MKMLNIAVLVGLSAFGGGAIAETTVQASVEQASAVQVSKAIDVAPGAADTGVSAQAAGAGLGTAAVAPMVIIGATIIAGAANTLGGDDNTATNHHSTTTHH